MAGAADLTKLVPGFDFLQNLMKNAGAGLPSMGQWIAPTLNPEELDKRIQELKTVQYWLEQNARLLATTIQALEVQRMTLSTLQTMNLPLADLRDALKIGRPAAPAPAPAWPTGSSTPAREPEPEPEPAPARRKAPARKSSAAEKKAAAAPAPSPIDPLQWWGALTQQFTEIAAKAVKDSATDTALNLAGAAVKQGMATAGSALKKAATLPGQAAQAAAGAVGVAKPRKRR